MSREYRFRFEDGVIEKVTESDGWWSVGLKGSWGFGIEMAEGRREPKVGDMITVKLSGTQIAGVWIEGEKLYDKEAWELELEHEEWVCKHKLGQIKAFRENVKKHDERIKALPGPLQLRMERFREKDLKFRWESESYELFCCEQAAVIAKAFEGNPAGIRPFQDMEWEEQKKLVPGLDPGHSGNTFGGACCMAHLLLTDPSKIIPKKLSPEEEEERRASDSF